MAPRGGSCPGGRGSQGPPGAAALRYPLPGGRSAISSRVSGSSAPRVSPRLPGACPRAQGDPPSSWPCLLSPRPLPPPSGSRGLRSRPRVASSSFFRQACQTQAASPVHPFSAPVAPRVIGVYRLGVLRTPASGEQRFSSGASRAPRSLPQIR